MVNVHCELLDHHFRMPEHPERVVCLTSGVTEALFAMGCGDRVVGVSAYCARYVPDLKCPVAGDYLHVDEALLAELQPDLVLITTGAQRPLGLKLARQGLPVYAVPLPNSCYGILENIVTAAALLNRVTAGRRLCDEMARRAAALRMTAPERRPAVYAELWFGRHARTIGGRTFIHDLIEIAGGDPIHADSGSAYRELALADVANHTPDVMIGFAEPEYPVDFRGLLAQRGWDRTFAPVLIQSTVARGRNVIHDGPSLLETAAWLQGELRAAVATIR